MAIKCGENPLLAKVQASKDALKEKMAGIKVPGVDVSAQLASIKAAKDKLKADLLASVPSIPKLPDFQKELQGLIKDLTAGIPGVNNLKLSAKLQAFENQWGDAVQDVGQLVATLSDPIKLLTVNVCDQPDIEGEMDPVTGKLKKVDKPLIAQDSTEGPKKDTRPLFAMSLASSLIPGASLITDSDVDSYGCLKARDAIEKATKDTLGPIKKEMKNIKKAAEKTKKRVNKEYEKDTGKKTPFSKKYPDAMGWEYYLIENKTPPPAVEDYTRAQIKYWALDDMLKKVEGFIDYIDLRIFDMNAMETLSLWEGSKWNDEFDVSLRKKIYESQGFGIWKYNNTYGRRMAAKSSLQESINKIKNSYILAPRDYTASKLPTVYSLTDFVNDSSGEKITTYKNLFQDTVNAVCNATVPEFSNKNALAMKAAWASKQLLSDITSNMPTAADFIPKSLGGNLAPYEDIILGATAVEENSETSTYTSDTFVPHYMYLAGSTVYVTSHDQHVELSSLGYTHSQS
jgi:hypothetical protein